MPTPMRFGEILGFPQGSVFEDRTALHAAGLHRRTQHGISGLESEGADAIILNGGYKDDLDFGTVVIYTDEGGIEGGRIVRAQTFTGGNRALVVSCEEELPVRVIRGYRGDPRYRTTSGYRYDGLYRVASYWQEPSKDGPTICRFRLEYSGADATEIEAVDAQSAAAIHSAPAPSPPAPPTTAPGPGGAADRVISVANRLARRAEVARWVKQLYDHTCQVCGLRLAFASGPYAECAHIQPLGHPHNGPDDPGNVLCLCPTDHVKLDRGAIVIHESGGFEDRVTPGRTGELQVKPPHVLSAECVNYHGRLWRNT